MPKGKGYGKKRSEFLPKHVQKSSKKSQKRFITWTTGTPKAKAKLLEKSKKSSRKKGR